MAEDALIDIVDQNPMIGNVGQGPVAMFSPGSNWDDEFDNGHRKQKGAPEQGIDNIDQQRQNAPQRGGQNLAQHIVVPVNSAHVHAQARYSSFRESINSLTEMILLTR